MNAKISQLIRLSGLLSGAALVLSGVRVTAASNPGATATVTQASSSSVSNAELAAAVESFPTFNSYIKLSGQAAAVTGNDAAFQRRLQQSDSVGAGIEELRYSRAMRQGGTWEVDGRALAGSEDYLAHFRITKEELGSLDVGFKRFRTFYDGIGGFFPLNGQWNALANEDLHVDRSKFWIEHTLPLQNSAVFTLRYTNETRNGQKDSTIWGDSDFTGLPNNTPPISQVRKMSPSYIDLSERHQLLEGTLKQTIGKTTYQLTIAGDQINNFDTRHVTRFPGEVRPFPTPAATVLLPAASMNNQVVLTHSEGIEARSTHFTGKIDTALTDQLTLQLGGSYEVLNSDVSGDRTLVTDTPTATGVRQITTANFLGLTGGSHIVTTTGNVALDYKATSDLFVKVAMRGESEDLSGSSQYNVQAASGTPAVTVTTTPRVSWTNLSQHSWTPVLDVRYTGIHDLALYFSGSLRNLNGNEHNSSAYNPLTAPQGTLAYNNVSENHGNYTLGANWRVSSMLDVRGEFFRKSHKNQYGGFEVSFGDFYLVGSEFRGVKLTAIAKPAATVSFTSRYVYQRGQMQVTGFLPTFPAYDSCDALNYTFSESIDWTPNQQCYVQVNANLVFNTINTVYPRAGFTAPTATNLGFNTNSVLQNSDNNYFSGSAIAGWAAARKTDVQVQVTYYRANNGNAYLAPLTLPYGAAVKEYSATVGIKHKLDERLVLNAKVGYFDSVNDTTGGFTNFRGPLAYLSFDYAL